MGRIGFGINAVPFSAESKILSIFRSGYYSPGRTIQEFEDRFKEIHRAKYAIFVNSGTDALRLSLLALKERYGIADGEFVAVPSVTFTATVNVVLQIGLKPFFVDVGILSYTMNPDNLFWRLTTGGKIPKVVLPVHLFGRSCEEGIYSIAKTHGMAVLEDSCETILNPVRGDVSCHSTYMAHHVTTGVGGFALTNDKKLNEIIRSLANHGRDPYYLPGHRHPALSEKLLKSRFRFVRNGYSCRGTEFEAALGLSQMTHLKERILKRRENARRLKEILAFEELQLPQDSPSHTWMMFPILLKKGDKYKLCKQLEEDGIETRDMMPITNQPCFQAYVNEDQFTVAKEINAKGFYIPCHQGLRSEDIERIGRSFKKFLTKR